MARRGVRLVFVLLLIATIVSMSAMVTTYLLMYGEPTVPSRSTLILRIGGLAEGPQADPLAGLLATRQDLTLEQVLEGLRKAKTDRRVESVLIVPEALPVAYWAKLQEVRDAIIDFRESGKPAYAYLEYGGEREYYLATAADRVFLMPASPLDLTGLASYEIFMRGLLDNLGVVADLHHVGDFKTAPNQLTETTFTEDHLEMATWLNQDMFEQLVADTAAARSKTEAEMRSLIDEGPFLAQAALAAGLVDELAYADQVEDFIAGAEDGDDGDDRTAGRRVRLIEGEDYAQVRASSVGVRTEERMGLIYIAGTIASGDGGFDPLYGSISGSDAVVDQIRRARDDDSTSAIIVRIDSPGGSTIASDVIWRELQLTREDDPERPIIVSMSDLAASGGYYVATPAHAIVAQPGTLTGSIGIYGGKIMIGGLYEKLGMNIETVSAGRHSDMNSPIRPYNDLERAKLEEQLHDFYRQFVQKVADARGMSWDAVDAIAQGRVWTGKQAKEIGLVDELGGLATAVRVAKRHAEIDEDAGVELVSYVRRRSVFDVLGQFVRAGELGVARRLLPELARVAAPLGRAAAAAPGGLFRRGEALALAPFF